jgi:hypothetical protein
MGQAVTPHPPPISITCSKWFIRKAPFVLGAQPLDKSPLCSSGLLNKLASQKLWCYLSLCLSPSGTFLGVHPGFGGWRFHLLVTSSMSPARQEIQPCQEPLDRVDPGKGGSLPASQGVSSSCTKEPGKAQEPTWEPCSSDW